MRFIGAAPKRALLRGRMLWYLSASGSGVAIRKSERRRAL
jgi:hypothetical protein